MKKCYYIPVLLFLIVISMGSCSDAEQAKQKAGVDSTAVSTAKDSLVGTTPTETFRGRYNDSDVIFSHFDFKSYRLNLGGRLSSGVLNTERGYGDDPNATVYILNSDKPKNEQKYFVRTPAGSVYMLDQNRYVMEDAFFDLSSGQKVKPPVSEKSKVEINAKKKALKNKPIKEKKISKSKKKKKSVRKARKKNRKKKKLARKPSAKQPIKSNQ